MVRKNSWNTDNPAEGECFYIMALWQTFKYWHWLLKCVQRWRNGEEENIKLHLQAKISRAGILNLKPHSVYYFSASYRTKDCTSWWVCVEWMIKQLWNGLLEAVAMFFESQWLTLCTIHSPSLHSRPQTGCAEGSHYDRLLRGEKIRNTPPPSPHKAIITCSILKHSCTLNTEKKLHTLTWGFLDTVFPFGKPVFCSLTTVNLKSKSESLVIMSV